MTYTLAMNEPTILKIDPQQDIASQLRKVGITPTQQRVQIAEILFSRPRHMSADQVLAMVNRDGPIASKATIYNTLGLFARKGLVREVIVDPSKVFYDSNTAVHHHFFNEDTGELTDIPSHELLLTRLPELPPGTEAAGIEVIFRLRSQDAAS